MKADDVALVQFDGIGLLPHFNPDQENEAWPAVLEWRRQLQHADAVVICSPEYAHGVPGVLKNALDWVVGSGEFMHKPVALINASPSSMFVQPQLRETLTVMMANVVDDASITLSLLGRKRDALSMVEGETVAAELRAALAALTKAIEGPGL